MLLVGEAECAPCNSASRTTASCVSIDNNGCLVIYRDTAHTSGTRKGVVHEDSRTNKGEVEVFTHDIVCFGLGGTVGHANRIDSIPVFTDVSDARVSDCDGYVLDRCGGGSGGGE